MLSDVGGWGLASVLDVQYLFFLLKKIGFFTMTWHYADPNINILLTRNLFLSLTSDSEAIIYHGIVCGLNRTTERVVNLNVTWLGFCFCFDFVRSHARCSCCSIDFLHFQVVQIKQVDCNTSTKNVNNYK